MSDEMAQKLVQGGIKAVQNGEPDLARKAFTKALQLEPNNEAAWLGMATITGGKTDKLRILKKVLEINPDNERAKEAIRRLAGDEEEVESATASAFTADIEEADAVMDAPVYDDELPEPPLPGDTIDSLPDSATSTGMISAIRDTTSGDTGDLSDFPIPDWSDDADISQAEGEALAEESVEPEPEPFILRSSEEMFAQAPKAPEKGRGGVPVLDAERVEEISEVVEASIQRYLEDALAEYLTPEYDWTKKTHGRAGSGEYRNFLLEVSAGILVFTFIVGAGLAAFIASNAAAQRIIFGPSNTPLPSPTWTPTATPGVTNTPSQTPRVPPTETPALDPSVTPGNPDHYFPPEPTDVYYPVSADDVLDQAVALMDRGNLVAAGDLIDEMVLIESETGAFPPVYRLSQWHLLNDQPDDARDVLDEWAEEWETRDASVFENSESLLNIAYARVNLYEAANGIGERFSLITDARSLLEDAIGISDNPLLVSDRVNADAWILLAQSYVIEGNIDEALDTIDQAYEQTFQFNRGTQNVRLSLYGDTRLRMERARILANAGRTAEAFQELSWVLELDPFLEEALIYQTELALETGQAGLGVLYAQQYLLYYPGSIRGFYLLGQAREAENKFDLALDAYSRALAGDYTDENYTGDPFFLTTLLARADLYVRQGLREAATNDFTLALDITNNNPEIRIFRLESSFAAGNYEDVLADAEELLDDGGIDESLVLYYQGAAWIELALADEDDSLDENYALAIESLDAALANGLSDDLQATAQEYLAIANLEERSFVNALDAINAALDATRTANRLYIRARILEAQGSISDALLDYEFVVTWGQYYGYPFYNDAVERYNDIIGRFGRR